MKPFGLLLLASAILGSLHARPVTIRVGYFPNITHAQAIVGSQSTREKHGWFEQRLGGEISVQWFPFNAGPSAMEAIFAGSIDLTYVGPNPAINAYIRSRGEEIRILAGAVEGGAALVVQSKSAIEHPADFRGRKVGTPQLGNTQDVAARAWLKQHGFKVTLTGGDVMVVPTPNAEQFQLFRQGRLDAVWTVEPWVSRLLLEAGGRVFLEQEDAVTTVLVASVEFLKKQPALAERFRAAHAELTAWLEGNPVEAQALVRAGLVATTMRDMSPALIASAWERLRFTDKVIEAQFTALVANAQSAGFLRNAIPLTRMFTASP
jgi:NitT/TauT family transport system substrate-binding protein